MERDLKTKGVQPPETRPYSTLEPGTLLQGRYEILEVLGVGGMGAVYKARDRRFEGVERICAVKEIFSELSPSVHQESVASFNREAQILVSLNHPAIPKVYDYFTEGQRSYLVMEFVEGKDLETILQETPSFIPLDTVVDWALQLCDVLHYLHNHKPNPIVFRDLKPSNIMLTHQGRIMLVDFGIARVFQKGLRGTMVGTEGYAPPEQYRGVVDPRSDIYSLGATLHHLLTRVDPRTEPPFSFHERPIRAINPLVPPALEAVIMKALEYEMDKRFSSAEEMKAAIIKALGGRKPLTVPIFQKEEVQEVKPLWVFQCEDEVRSSPAVAAGAVYIGSYDYNLYALDATTGKMLWKYPTKGGVVSTPFLWRRMVFFGSEDGNLYALDLSSGRTLWVFSTAGKVRSSPKVYGELVFFGSDDGNFYAVEATSGRLKWFFTTGAAIRSSPALFQDRIIFGSDDGFIYALKVADGYPIWRHYCGRRVVSSPVVSENLFFIGGFDFYVYAFNALSGWVVWRYKTRKPVVSTPAVVENTVYIGSADGHLYAFRAEDGKLLWKYATGDQVVSSPKVEEERVYFGSVDGFVYCLSASKGELLWRFLTGGPVVSSAALAGGVVYIGSCDGKLYALPSIPSQGV
ncbi:MAG: serine/threonine-protein kinase [Anaerolineae bacterium]|nr:serine/threonine-protein kinase [Anaerolineae bacterium]MDW8101485.1 serine/threonine-protein kinase [Anaerolineae bacterium]